MILDEISQVFNQSSARKIAKKTGLSHSRVYRLQMGCPFILDYPLLFALQRLGYDMHLVKIKK